MQPRTIELLAPARDLSCGIAAIEHGADAVYIGAPRFSARAAAGNSLADIGRLIKFAHQFHARVYIALNTVLKDEELDVAVKMIHQVHELGADAVIIQDMGLLECDLPPIALHGSTQMDNRTVDKVNFLQKIGFEQVVLARELSLKEIERISQHTSVALECFVHGALCVSFSGQCYISEVMTGRSANRGECAQFCRHQFTLKDGAGAIIEKGRHLLSLKDFNLSDKLGPLINAGICSFKIEGRLKDSNYVKNITALYRRRLDAIIENDTTLKRASSGRCTFSFVPDAEKSFYRGQTDYFLYGKKSRPASIYTPKSVGKKVARVRAVGWKHLDLAMDHALHNGDGLCYFDQQHHLIGFRINRVERNRVFPHKKVSPAKGTLIYRNHDIKFNRLVKVSEKCRKVDVSVSVRQTKSGLIFQVTDEDNITSFTSFEMERIAAKKPELTIEAITRQAGKSGDTIFAVTKIQVEVDSSSYFSQQQVKEVRREAFANHLNKRIDSYRVPEVNREPNSERWTDGETSYLNNVANSRAESFYRRHGAVMPMKSGEPEYLMSCKYCLKAQLGLCPEIEDKNDTYQEPFTLCDKNAEYRLLFDCSKCEMKVKKKDTC